MPAGKVKYRQRGITRRHKNGANDDITHSSPSANISENHWQKNKVKLY